MSSDGIERLLEMVVCTLAFLEKKRKEVLPTSISMRILTNEL